MKFTNKFGAPDAFFRAVINDQYDRRGTYSPSLLNSPARQAALIQRHFDELEIDVISRFASVFGQGVHSLLERAARPGVDLFEERFFTGLEVDGIDHKISAQIDLYESDTKTLIDWKTTKASAFLKKYGAGQKPEWTAQMNIARWIMSRLEKPLEVKRLQIVGLLKDWDEKSVKKNAAYPRLEVVAADQRLWTLEETEAYIVERIRAHEAAKFRLPHCTAQETWGGIRCARFCDAKQFCVQFKDSQKTGLIAPKKRSEE